MAYAVGETMVPTDLGKTLSNGSSEIANYNLFAITVKESSYNRIFTFLFSRSGGTIFGAVAPDTTTWKKTCTTKVYEFIISLSSNTFSITGYRNYNNTDAISCSITQIRVIM